MTEAERQHWRASARVYLGRAGIVLTAEEVDRIEIADLGLGRFEEVGLALVTYVNTRRVCAKELVLLPWQICPEHLHPAIDSEPGKEETFRCRWGRVHLFVDAPGRERSGSLPDLSYVREVELSAGHEVVLDPGGQFTLEPETFHWFYGGPHGAVVSEFSTRSRDAFDVYTDRRVRRGAVDGSERA